MIVGILFLLFSLPVCWLTITQAQGTAGSMLSSMHPAGPVMATGFSGNLGILGMQLPIWLVVSLGALSLILTVLNQRGITTLPKLAFVTPWIVSSIYVLIAFYLGILADGVAIHLGPVLATVGLGLGFRSGFAEWIKNA
mgnify:CR=1 FL=1